MLILSLPMRDTEALFQHGLGTSDWSAVCLGCGSTHVDTLTPVELMHDDADSVRPSGAALCRPCSLALPRLSAWVVREWPPVDVAQVEQLWAMVRAEQALEAAQQAARERAIATTLEDLKAACAALEKSTPHQGVDRVGKVA